MSARCERQPWSDGLTAKPCCSRPARPERQGGPRPDVGHWPTRPVGAFVGAKPRRGRSALECQLKTAARVLHAVHVSRGKVQSEIVRIACLNAGLVYVRQAGLQGLQSARQSEPATKPMPGGPLWSSGLDDGLQRSGCVIAVFTLGLSGSFGHRQDQGTER